MMSINLNLNELDPSEVLKPSALQSYESGLNLIWKELLRLNSNLFVLDKILKFPSEVVIGPQNNFFKLVNIGLTENSILVITKLVVDEGEEIASILRFKNWIKKQVKGKYKDAFDCVLRQKRIEIKALEKVGGKIKPIRVNLIAHLIVDGSYQLKYSGDLRISLQELNLICEKLNSLFDALCFGHKYALLPLEYDSRIQHPVGVDTRSDIEYFLDLIVKNSDWYKRPESLDWLAERPHLPPEDINLMNEYRRKYGEPEV